MSARLTDKELSEALEVAQGMCSLKLTAAIAELRERRADDARITGATQMTDAEMEEAKRVARGCQCTHEQGDSDCAQHPRCNNCDEDQAGTYLARKAALVPRLIAALESARRERDAWRERDHHSNVTLKLVLEQRDEAEQARDEYKEQRDCAARERDTARADAEQLRSALDVMRMERDAYRKDAEHLHDEDRPVRRELRLLKVEAEQLSAERDALAPLVTLLSDLKEEVLDASDLPPSWRATIATRNEFALYASQAWRTTKGDAGK